MKRAVASLAFVAAGMVGVSAFAAPFSENFESFTAGQVFNNANGLVVNPGNVFLSNGDSSRAAEIRNDNLGGHAGNYLMITGDDQHLVFGNATDMTQWNMSFDWYVPGDGPEVKVGTPLGGDFPFQMAWIGSGGDKGAFYHDGWTWVQPGGAWPPPKVSRVDGWNHIEISFDGTAMTFADTTTGESITQSSISTPSGYFRLTWQPGDAIDNIQLSDPNASVPEPASLGLLSLGALAMLRRRRA